MKRPFCLKHKMNYAAFFTSFFNRIKANIATQATTLATIIGESLRLAAELNWETTNIFFVF